MADKDIMGANSFSTAQPDAGAVPAASTTTSKRKYKLRKLTLWDHLSTVDKEKLKALRKRLQ